MGVSCALRTVELSGHTVSDAKVQIKRLSVSRFDSTVVHVSWFLVAVADYFRGPRMFHGLSAT